MTGAAIDADEFDETDLELLGCIEDDFDVSLDTLANELDLSKSAVHYRLNKLKENDVIQGITADLNPVSFGLTMVAITEVAVTHEHGYSENVGTELAELNGVEQVYYTMGDVDFVVISRVQDRTQMNEIIEDMVAIDSVNETSSRFVMDEIATNPKFMANLSDEMRSNLADGA
ncbi:Lrp/AsnC family transcriptional regulator [Haloplanus litoreus]|uniref:Lrp/AsnC family transcriptional regulator n=1 Tax=Haloplanus litoreus TaxID=767515 RepID=A0ABD6A298_9EURY